MTTNRVVTELIIDARGAATGSAEFQRRMEAAQRAVDRMIEREQKLNDTTQQTGQALERGAQSVGKRAKQWDALTAALDPVVAAEQRAAKAIREATQVADAGTRLLGKSQEEAAALVAEVTKRELAKVEAVKKGVEANKSLATSTGLARHEMINLSRQAQDVAVSLASGQSPFTVLLQQGTQVADVFAASGNGTVGGFFRQLGSGIASVVTPARLAGGAIVASAALAAFALNRWNDAQIALNRSLYGTGLSAGVTRQQLTELADEAAKASRVAASAARDTIAALAGTGRIDPRLLAGITAQARGVGATTGLDEAEANKLLAASFAEPISGYKRLTDALGGYNIQVEDHIKRLVTQGRLYEAQQVLLQQIPSRLAPINEVTNQWARAWSAVSRGIKDTLDEIAKLTGGPLGQFMDKWLEVQRRVQEAGGGERGLRRVAVQDNAAALVTDIQNKIKDAEARLAQLQAEAASANDIGRPYLQRRVRNVQAELDGYKSDLEKATREAERIDSGMRQIAQRTQQRTQQSQEQATAQREREAAAQGAARIDQVFADTQRAATTATDQRAQSEARLREELQRRVDGQNQATTAARQMGAADAQGLNDVRRQIDQYNQLTDTIRGMLVERSRNPGLAQNEQFRAQLEELARTQMAARAAIEGRFSGGGAGMFGPNGRFDAPDEEVISRFKRLADVTREQTQADVDAINARSQNQRIAAAQNQERIRMDQEGIAAGDANARATRNQGVAARIVAQDTRQLTDAERERRLATDATVESIRSETAALGGSIAQQEAARARTQMAADARREYIRLFGESARVPQAELDAIDEMARRMGNARQQAAELKAARDILFERQLIGLPDGTAQIARNLRQIYGDEGWRQQMDGSLAAMQRFNDTLKTTQDLAQDFGRTFVSDMMNGKSATEALGNAVKNLAARLVQMAMDQAIKSLFGGLLSAFGGALGGFGGGSTMTAILANGGVLNGGNLVPFANGGAFTNSIVTRPTVFPMANGTGLMGEAGPEAVMPLKRDGRGRLGVTVSGGGGGGNVTSIRMGDTNITIGGNADKDTLSTLKAELDRRDKAMEEKIPRLVTQGRRDRLISKAA